MGLGDLMRTFGMDKMFDKKYSIAMMIIIILLISGTENVAAQSPDLIVSDIVYNPTNPSVGSSITLTVTIKNQGNY